MRILRTLIVFIVLGLLAVFVWPTQFRYDHMTVDGDLVPVRIDRFNGNADMLLPDQGWVPVEGTDSGGGDAPAARRS